MFEVVFSPGQHIARAAEELSSAANEHGAATGTFNDIVLTALRGQPPQEIVASFDEQLRESGRRYRESPAGIAAAKAAASRLSDSQAIYDGHMASLAVLDFNSQAAILDWLCGIQDATDHVGVLTIPSEITLAFAKHGYEPGVYCGDKFDGESPDIFARWVIGQALDGLQKIGAIHPIIHKFAGQWKSKFSAGSDQLPALSPTRSGEEGQGSCSAPTNPTEV